MPLQRIQVIVHSSTETAFISDVLFELGALSVSVEDNFRGRDNECPIYGEPPQVGTLGNDSPNVWQNAKISALYPIGYDVEQLTMFIGTKFGLIQSPTFSLQTDVFDEKDPDTWVREVQESFVPIVVGNIRISYPWHNPDPSFTNVQLEPGMAFGTGEHSTTKLCLSWLQRTIKPGLSLLDYGTGSGVLAIASVLVAENISAVGVDLDPEAVNTAISNAKRNQVEDHIMFCENRNEPQDRLYDVVVANILAEPLKHLAGELVRRMKSGACIALSGVLCSQAVEVTESYQGEGVTLQQAEVDDGWALLIGTKP
ncbi:Ribosomal protein L11 methyltransferase [Gracilariopsis chorda]|uniref:ETFB lysine methyltransferase n=1 Tax=Gracilariopsis chorda TaxID=448386 RepID=A0A2V3J6E2_9FLOR|nr:Ribosomal protein L11 methyltransferase [Gracilariopsis chorda]|eukprot:PXF49975.1 Ribosomal protein L11 methyltransferase [Gracilariopsis chorda]